MSTDRFLNETYVPSRQADGSYVKIVIGSRVELSPACDLWMRGARFGTVRGMELDEHGREVVIVKMDHRKVKRLQRFFPAYLTHAEAVREAHHNASPARGQS